MPRIVQDDELRGLPAANRRTDDGLGGWLSRWKERQALRQQQRAERRDERRALRERAKQRLQTKRERFLQQQAAQAVQVMGRTALGRKQLERVARRHPKSALGRRARALLRSPGAQPVRAPQPQPQPSARRPVTPAPVASAPVGVFHATLAQSRLFAPQELRLLVQRYQQGFRAFGFWEQTRYGRQPEKLKLLAYAYRVAAGEGAGRRPSPGVAPAARQMAPARGTRPLAPPIAPTPQRAPVNVGPAAWPPAEFELEEQDFNLEQPAAAPEAFAPMNQAPVTAAPDFFDDTSAAELTAETAGEVASAVAIDNLLSGFDTDGLPLSANQGSADFDADWDEGF